MKYKGEVELTPGGFAIYTPTRPAGSALDSRLLIYIRETELRRGSYGSKYKKVMFYSSDKQINMQVILNNENS